MTSLNFSLNNFSGEPKGEGPLLAPRFTKRGDADGLLGERGGALPPRNMDAELIEAAFPFEIPGKLKGMPLFASSMKAFTCIHTAEGEPHTPMQDFSSLIMKKS